MRSLLVTCVFLTAPAALAQGAVPPFQISQVNPQPGFAVGAGMPGNDIQQVHMIHVPGDPSNIFVVGATVTGLPTTGGGVGGSDLVSGRYDVLTDTFTFDMYAAGLNAAGTDFGLTYHPDGLHAVWDFLPGPPKLATRPNTSSPWNYVATISGLPSQAYYDPALANINGVPHLIHVDGVNIGMSPIDLTTGAITGPTTVIATSAFAGSTANSPTPICDSTGELIGLSHHDVLGQDNDHYLSLDLDPLTPAVLMNDTTSWTNNGGFIGGRFFDAEYLPAPYHIFTIDTYWCTGGRASPGGIMEIRAFTPPTTSGAIYLSYLLIGGGYGPGIPVPGINGLFGLSSVFVDIAMPTHDNNNGESLLTLAVPPSPGLSGLILPVQSLTLDVFASTLTFGNTAAMTIN